MFEESLVRNCSPTLAGLKTGNLFRYIYGNKDMDEIERCADELRKKDISITIMRGDGEFYLVYIYRKKLLHDDLRKEGVGDFLSGIGYDPTDTDAAIERLRERMDDEEFPHEVGLFLGYPLHDVLGFINNNGRDCRFCGCWKVYDNEHQVKEQFLKFKECRRTLVEQHNAGVGLLQLAM